MTRLATSFLCAIAIGTALVDARQEPKFTGGTNNVSIYATVLDEQGRLVTSLDKDDFEIFDNGVKQDLTVFANDVQPITIVIMLDRSQSMERNFSLVKSGAEAFVDNLIAGDRARIGSFSDRIQIDPQTFTSDRDDLLHILHDNLQPAGITPLWNATSVAMTALAHEQGRRVVLVFTDGYNAPDWSTMNVTFAQVRNRSQAESVMVYAIGLADSCAPANGTLSWPGPRFQARGPGGRAPGGRRGPAGRPIPFPIPRGPGGPRDPFPVPRPPSLPPTLPPNDAPRGGAGDDEGVAKGDTHVKPCYDSKPDPDLRQLASVSGGGYFELKGTENLSSTFARVADELHHQYLLAFVPPRLDGEVHRLEVKVRRADTVVRARQSYVAMTDAPAGAGEPGAKRAER